MHLPGDRAEPARSRDGVARGRPSGGGVVAIFDLAQLAERYHRAGMPAPVALSTAVYLLVRRRDESRRESHLKGRCASGRMAGADDLSQSRVDRQVQGRIDPPVEVGERPTRTLNCNPKTRVGKSESSHAKVGRSSSRTDLVARTRIASPDWDKADTTRKGARPIEACKSRHAMKAESRKKPTRLVGSRSRPIRKDHRRSHLAGR